MVADYENWLYCTSIIRRKERKIWWKRRRRRWWRRSVDGGDGEYRKSWFKYAEKEEECPDNVISSPPRLVQSRKQLLTTSCLSFDIQFQLLPYITSLLTLSSLFHLFILYLSLNCLSIPFASATIQEYQNPSDEVTGEICSSIDVRNNVDSFRQLEDCEVIEGFLQIVLMDKTNSSAFVNLTFPKLREITGYLLLYRINGLKTLANLFPNLSVIRGQDLFINYALAVYEMLHLQELGLHSLNDIARGFVFITKNPLLCYVDTIDWSRILNSNSSVDNNLIVDNRQSNACPKCPTFTDPLCGYDNLTKQSLCWNAHKCQKICPNCPLNNKCTDDGTCCDRHCLGGCFGTSSNDCYACKRVVNGTNQCLDQCPSSYFEFRERRCITASQCYDTPKSKEDFTLQIRSKPFKPHEGKCVIECPPYYEEVAPETELGQFTCQPCKGACRKVCEAANVDSIQSAQNLKGCVIINGSLEIQIRGGGDIIKELEDSFSTIEEITGYLKIVRTKSLVSLNFLRKLKVINGDKLENGKYVLVVLDNQNLAELWDFARRDSDLIVRRGHLFFHFNPQLCYYKIIDLQKKLNLEPANDTEVARNSNGDKVACNITALYVSVGRVDSNLTMITWIPYTHFEPRTLLGYVVYYMEAPANVTVSMNDGRNGCSEDGWWNTIDVKVPDVHNGTSARDNVSMVIPHLKPYTRYAYYVKTYTVANEPHGAQSQIQYFRTNPATPTPPKQLKITSISSSEILLRWQPPDRINGKLVKYIVSGKLLASGQELLKQRNYCIDSVDLDKKDPKEEKRKNSVKILEIIPEKSRKIEECKCVVPEVQPRIKKNDQEVQILIEFENKLHDYIFFKLPQNNSSQTRSRRHANFDVNKNQITNLLISNESRNSSKDFENETSINFTPEFAFRYELFNTTDLEFKIQNLTHFTEYSIAVQACREKVLKNDVLPECSTSKIGNIQTLPLADADRIDPATVQLSLLNDTAGINLKWEPPSKTNGPILTYIIQYKRMELENQQPQLQCVTSQEFERKDRQHQLKTLHPGNYSVMIRATTLAKDIGINFTPPRYFSIKESEGPIVHQLVLGASFAVCIIIFIVIILLITVRYFYPDSWSRKNRLIATVNPEYFKPVQGFDKWEVPKKNITFDNLLGMGHFGEVYEGRAKGIIEKGVTTKVAIKTITKLPANQQTWTNFLHEASVMKQFNTHHVIKFLGVVTVGEPLVIMELMTKGDLRTYLRACREDVPEEERKVPLLSPPCLEEILQIAAEIADGMLYLSDKKFVHRDLAARNCMINAEGTVKIGDFGLTRDVYEAAYYRKDNDSRGHLPVRWMSPESLRDGLFLSQSDVWSYGIVLWEMATLASLPYSGLGNGEVTPYVINGGCMETPENCPAILGNLMKQCWKFDYRQRPTFAEILDRLMPHIQDEFANVSYYHTNECIQIRSKAENRTSEKGEMCEKVETQIEAEVLDEPTSSTPLRAMEDFEDFSLHSDEEEGSENILNRDDEREKFKDEVTTNRGVNNSCATHSFRTLPTNNGYIEKNSIFHAR